MEHPAMIAPVLALIAWTLLVAAYMGRMRFRAVAKAGIDLAENRGGRGQDLDAVLAARTMWPAHNYNNLLEQPTLFYALALALAVMGDNSLLTVVLGWAYVFVRVVHSLYQITVNIVMTRARLFIVANLILLALTVDAGWRYLG